MMDAAPNPDHVYELWTWIGIATTRLGETAKARIEREIEAHYEDAVCHGLDQGLSPDEAHRAALGGFGSAKKARRAYARTHLTEGQEATLRGLLTPPPPWYRDFRPYLRRLWGGALAAALALHLVVLVLWWTGEFGDVLRPPRSTILVGWVLGVGLYVEMRMSARRLVREARATGLLLRIYAWLALLVSLVAFLVLANPTDLLTSVMLCLWGMVPLLWLVRGVLPIQRKAHQNHIPLDPPPLPMEGQDLLDLGHKYWIRKPFKIPMP